MDGFLDLHLGKHSLIFQFSVLRAFSPAKLRTSVGQKGLIIGPKESVGHIVDALHRLVWMGVLIKPGSPLKEPTTLASLCCPLYYGFGPYSALIVWGLTVLLLLRSLQEESSWGGSIGMCEDSESHGTLLVLLNAGAPECQGVSAVGGLRIQNPSGLAGSGRPCKKSRRSSRVGLGWEVEEAYAGGGMAWAKVQGSMVKDTVEDSLASIKCSCESVWERSLERQVGAWLWKALAVRRLGAYCGESMGLGIGFIHSFFQ